MREVVQNLAQESTCCHPEFAGTAGRAVAFAGLELIRRKSLIKHCLKLMVSF